MAVLSKTRSILSRSAGGTRTYIQADEETGEVNRQLYLDVQTYHDLGCPATITVTVEPGDTLN